MSFGADLVKFQGDAIKATEKTARGTAIALWRAVIFDSPVDSGRFRGNWIASDGAPIETTYSITDKQGTTTVNKATVSTLSSSDWQSLWLSNNLPYAQRLEYGWSDQAPEGMVRKNVIRFQDILDKEARKN